MMRQATSSTGIHAASPSDGRPVRRRNALTSVVTDVDWSISYAALLLYVVIITTYRIPFGSVVITIALVGLVMERRPRLSGLMVWLGGLFAVAFMTQFSSPWPTVVRSELIDFAKVIVIVLVATTTLNTKARIRLFMIVSLAAFAMYPARGALFNYFLSGYSLLGRAIWNNIYANPNDMAAFTLLQLSVAAALVVKEPRGLYRLGAVAALVVTPLIILLTQSRGGFLGAAVFGLLAFTMYRRKMRLVGLLAIVGVVAVLILPSAAWDRFAMVKTIGQGGTESLETLEDDGSAQQRYEIWQTSFRIIQDHPVVGTGWGAYKRANAHYSPQLGNRDTHSTYFNIAAELGIPGLLLFVGLLVATFMRAQKARKLLTRTDPYSAMQIRFVALGLLGFLIAAVFATYSGITLFYLHIALIWSLADIHVNAVRAERRRALKPRRGAVAFAPMRI
jgi:probable O-glycosylation ligase (exosortase A-associated)